MKKTLLSSIVLLFTLFAFSQNNYWKQVAVKDANSFTKGKELYPGSFKPSAYKLFNLNSEVFAGLLKQSPKENITSAEESNFIISLPVADGSIEKFRVTESPVMQPKLQAKYPDIKTYSGKGITDPTSTIRFDFSPQGFHAIIISPKRPTVYINPITTAKDLYTVFDRTNIAQEKNIFDCKVDMIANSQIQGTEKATTTSGNNLRTYRFAVASGGEFSQLFLDGTETSDAQRKVKVLAALVTDLIRIDAIFETDFGIRLSYVDNEDTIIFLDKTTDPFQSNEAGSSGKWNMQSQKAIDKYIGTANYDIGHLLMGYPTGGNAGCIGCVCNAANKGAGFTGFTTDLTGDPFIIDFWIHEIGHQFGANHTFDHIYEGTIAQREPGSASTIMGYAGYTGSTDIQPHSDAYFHAISIQQINDYTTSSLGSTCPVLTSMHDYMPTVNAGKNYIVPKSTPFVLTGKSTDKNGHDTLTYCWEQFDNFVNNGTSNKFPNENSTTGPVFRSFNPSLSNRRFIPSLSSILDGTNTNTWEVLPAVTRDLNFRLTVRDNRAGGGRTNSSDVMVHVDGGSGPFKVTSPNTDVVWKAGTDHFIKWNVRHTDLAPVNCSKVKILLSLDGGLTFDTLKNSTSNDGFVQVTLPADISSPHARIKVAAVDNIFFDISDVDFKISPADGFADIATANTTAKHITVQPNPAKNYTSIIFNEALHNCTVTLSNNNGKIVFNKNFNELLKGTTEKISLAGLNKGIYFLKVVGDDGLQTEKMVIE